MDFADASLVAVADSRNMRKVFIINSDFYIYRLREHYDEAMRLGREYRQSLRPKDNEEIA